MNFITDILFKIAFNGVAYTSIEPTLSNSHGRLGKRSTDGKRLGGRFSRIPTVKGICRSSGDEGESLRASHGSLILDDGTDRNATVGSRKSD